MYGFIYITTNTINGKKYLGMCKHDKRCSDTYLGSGKHLKQAISKYGKDNFTREIIAEYSSKEELSNAEIEFIKEYNCVESREWYNITIGGYTTLGFAGKTHTEEHKQYLSEKFKGKKRPKHVGEAVAKANSERVFTDEMRERVSKYQKEHSAVAKSITVDGITYKSLTEAEEKTGISKYFLRKMLIS